MTPRSAFTMIELLMVVAVIAILAAIAVPNFLEAQVRSKLGRTMSELADTQAALSAYHADWRAYPPSNRDLLELVAVMSTVREQSRRRVKPDAGGSVQDADGEAADHSAQQGTPWLLRSFADPLPPTPDHARMAWRTEDRRSRGYLDLWRYEESQGGPTSPPWWSSDLDLVVLTTPIAYQQGGLSVDVFADTRGRGFRYLNPADLRRFDIPLPALRPQARYLLKGIGPSTDEFSAFGDGEVSLSHGPFRPYDPTNGTVSLGGLYRFGCE